MSAALESLSLAQSCRVWGGDGLCSPVSGAKLHRDGPNSIAAGRERWPVIDGIPFLRTGCPDLVRAALQAIDRGDLASAAALLLQDRPAGTDCGAAPPLEALRTLVQRRPVLGFREAMRGLGFGFSAEYFAHRWSDPTFLSGLALAEAHWQAPARVVEIGCGAGHFLRAFGRRTEAWGGDLVYAHLWLARHWVAAEASLVCFDATSAWPFEDGTADLVFSHDTLHEVADRAAAAAEMARVAGGEGAILNGHVRGLVMQDAIRLFGPSALYDDAELTAALIARRAPRACADAGGAARAFSVASGRAAAQSPRPVQGLLAMPPRGAALRRNPLYCEDADGACIRRFPSRRYGEEIGRLATYPPHVTARGRVTAGADPADDALIRRRVWVDLPPRW